MRADPKQFPSRHEQAGFALIAVLAVTALLSGLLLGLSLWTRNSVEAAAVAASEVRMDALLRSAVNVTAYQLIVLKLPATQVNGQKIALDGGTATISVDDDSGKVDLNAAGPELLAAAYRASGLARMPPETFAARVMDWRDENDEAAPHGAEAATYRNAGLAPPRNGAFRTVSDLGWVLGVSQPDLASLVPFVTVFNPRGRLNPHTAPPALIRRLPGMTPNLLRRVFALAGSTRSEADEASMRTSEELAALLDFDPPAVLRFSIDSSLADQMQTKRIVVWISGDKSEQAAFYILDFKE